LNGALDDIAPEWNVRRRLQVNGSPAETGSPKNYETRVLVVTSTVSGRLETATHYRAGFTRDTLVVYDLHRPRQR
jgi:hypothetical protein